MQRNAIVGQSGGPTAVINASLAGVLSACRESGIPTVYGMRYGVQGLLKGQTIDLSAAISTEEDERLLCETPASYLGSCRYKLPDPQTQPQDCERIFAALRDLNIGYFFYIGGNDSMDAVCKLSSYAAKAGNDVRFIGVPKTIDNDLLHTDHTPGYGSAAKYIATSVKELVRDSTIYDIKSVTVVEIMGRNAGWLTAAAALARDVDCEGAALICLPELPFEQERFLDRIDQLQRTQPSLVVCVSEGMRMADGRYVCELGADKLRVDAFGHKYLGGTAQALASLIAGRLGVKTRGVELSTLQRCAAHAASRTDVREAFHAGEAAVRAALDGKTGQMVSLRRTGDDPYACEMVLCAAHDVANREKTVPLEWIDSENFGIREPFLRYARPLILGDLSQTLVNGLPRHLVR